jgi:hypothetical protein
VNDETRVAIAENDIRYIRNAVDEIRSDQKAQNGRLDEYGTRITKLETAKAVGIWTAFVAIPTAIATGAAAVKLWLTKGS